MKQHKDDPYIRRFRTLLRILEREIGESLSSQIECCGLSLSQCHALLSVADRESVTAGELADELALDKSTLSRTISNLEERGWLVRGNDPENRRKSPLGLSEAGRRKIEEVDSRCDAEYAEALGEIPAADRETLARGMELLAGILAAQRVDGACCARKSRGGAEGATVSVSETRRATNKEQP